MCSSDLLARVSLNEGFLAPDLTRVYSPTTRALQSPPGTRDSVRNNYFLAAGRPADTQVLGATFSVGSMSWCGSLSHNRYNNNVSRLTKNVIDGFLKNGPLP